MTPPPTPTAVPSQSTLIASGPSSALVIAAGATAAVLSFSAIYGLARYLRRRFWRARSALPIQNTPADEDVSSKGEELMPEAVALPTTDEISTVEKRDSKLRPLALPLKVARDMQPPKKGLLPIFISKRRYRCKHVRSASMPSLSVTPTFPFSEEADCKEVRRNTIHYTPCSAKAADIKDDNAGRRCDISSTTRADTVHQHTGDSNNNITYDSNEDMSTIRDDNICASLETSIGEDDTATQQRSESLKTVNVKTVEINVPVGEEHVHEHAEVESLETANDSGLRRSSAVPSLTDIPEADEQSDTSADEADKPQTPCKITTRPMRPSRVEVPDLTQFLDELFIDSYEHDLAVKYWPNAIPESKSSKPQEVQQQLAAPQEAQESYESSYYPGYECISDDKTDADWSIFTTRKDLVERADDVSFYSWVAADPTYTIAPLKPKPKKAKEPEVKVEATASQAVHIQNSVDDKSVSREQTRSRIPVLGSKKTMAPSTMKDRRRAAILAHSPLEVAKPSVTTPAPVLRSMKPTASSVMKDRRRAAIFAESPLKITKPSDTTPVPMLSSRKPTASSTMKDRRRAAIFAQPPPEVAKRSDTKPRAPLGVITNTFGLVTPRTGLKPKPTSPPSPSLLLNGSLVGDDDYSRPGGIIELGADEMPDDPKLLFSEWKAPNDGFKVLMRLKKPVHRAGANRDEEYDPDYTPFVVKAFYLENSLDTFRENVEKRLGFPIVLRGMVECGFSSPLYIPITSEVYFRRFLKACYEGRSFLQLDAWRDPDAV